MEMVDVLRVYLDSIRVNLEMKTVPNVLQILTLIVKLEAHHAVSCGNVLFYQNTKIYSFGICFPSSYRHISRTDCVLSLVLFVVCSPGTEGDGGNMYRLCFILPAWWCGW